MHSLFAHSDHTALLLHLRCCLPAACLLPACRSATSACSGTCAFMRRACWTSLRSRRGEPVPPPPPPPRCIFDCIFTAAIEILRQPTPVRDCLLQWCHSPAETLLLLPVPSHCRCCSEIQFRQVAGDFERFQGKWMLQGVAVPTGSASSSGNCSSSSSSSSSSSGSGSGSGSSSSGSDSDQPSPPGATSGAAQQQQQQVAAPPAATTTQLKYAVEIVMPRATRMLGALEPLLERAVFEDVPANLAAIKARCEALAGEAAVAALEAAGESSAAAALRRRLERPPLAGMIADFWVLAAELERCFGDGDRDGRRVLPSRSELREMNRRVHVAGKPRSNPVGGA